MLGWKRIYKVLGAICILGDDEDDGRGAARYFREKSSPFVVVVVGMVSTFCLVFLIRDGGRIKDDEGSWANSWNVYTGGQGDRYLERRDTARASSAQQRKQTDDTL